MTLDLRAKLALALGLLVAGMLGGLAVAALAFLAAEGLLLASGLARAQRPLGWAALGLVPFALLDGVLLGSVPLAALGPLVLHTDGLLMGLAFALRALAALALGLWLLRTAAARDALRLLHRWPRVAVLVAGTMRFAPLAAQDWSRVREAMAMRGLEPGPGARGAMRGASLLVPLFVLSVRRGQAVDEALQASAFGSGPRTPPRRSALPWSHVAAALAGLALGALAILRAVFP
ncbi:MAG: energy-coupling factor transporter transmembrane protein EcfT [Halobacteriales archaeon]|nr:energy-coupling factor transporter transmembrane protein EcfT [Halobacteriales archaeon]